MVFNSWQFLLFFPLVALVFFVLAMMLRSTLLCRLFLLAASLFFYACWNPAYLGLMLISVLVTWLSGLLMEGGDGGRKRLVLAGSLVINLGILFFFKYYGFFAASAEFASNGAFHLSAFDVLLPVGISFYTFQALGYSIDLYYGRVGAERNIITYALFVTFFPQLVAGPIERTGNLLPQFHHIAEDGNHWFDYDRITSGLRLAAWGMFKKVVIADRLAIYVNAVYGDPSAYPGASLALATFFFAFQIYCDFSGYSDIAIGTARVLGFKLMTNFRQPYFAASITEFWRRWHISLSTWLKDYLYIPLGGGRKGPARQKLNLGITFLLSGLWHGAAWHFVIWGAFHGAYRIVERSVDNLRSGFRRAGEGRDPSPAAKLFRVCLTFTLVCFAWIFFRADSMGDALAILAKLAGLPAELAGYVRGLPGTGLIGTARAAFQLGLNVSSPVAGFGLANFGLSVLCIALLIIHDLWERTTPDGTENTRKPLLLRWAGYYALVMTILLSWNAGQSQFIYFTF